MANRGATQTYKCKSCKQPFTARTADRNRGWACFCSKSCKAIKQTQKTSWPGPGSGVRPGAEHRDEDIWVGHLHDDTHFLDGHGQW